MNDVTRILSAMEQGDQQAAEQLLPQVYQELRKLAARKLAQEKPGQTLQPTALVHEAYLRLLGKSDLHMESRRHFFFAAARAMRDILVERARANETVQAVRDMASAPTYTPDLETRPRDTAHWPFIGSVVDYLEGRRSGQAIPPMPRNIGLPWM